MIFLDGVQFEWDIGFLCFDTKDCVEYRMEREIKYAIRFVVLFINLNAPLPLTSRTHIEGVELMIITYNFLMHSIF